MVTFLSLLSLVIIFACLLGLINPTLVKQNSRGKVLKTYGLGALLTFLVIGILVEPTDKSPAVNSEHSKQAAVQPVVHAYEIIDKQDTSFSGRKRLRWVITAPTAMTQLDRAATAKAAAKDLQEKTNADLAQIWLEVAPFTAGQGSQLARATYIPDGCGNSGKDCNGKIWSISASSVQLTDEQIAVWKAWRDNREKFMQEGYVDEERLKEFLAPMFNTTPDKITLPWIESENVTL